MEKWAQILLRKNKYLYMELRKESRTSVFKNEQKNNNKNLVGISD